MFLEKNEYFQARSRTDTLGSLISGGPNKRGGGWKVPRDVLAGEVGISRGGWKFGLTMHQQPLIQKSP